MFRWFTQQPGSRRTKPKPQSRQLLLEHLEDRVVPTTGFANPNDIANGNGTEAAPATATVFDKQGNTSLGIVAWTSVNSNNDTEIFASFTSFGNIGSSFQVTNPDEDTSDSQPAVAIAPDGNGVVVWRHTDTNGNTSIVFAGFNGGTELFRATVVSTSNNVANPEVAIDSKGRFIITYQEEQTTTTSKGSFTTQNIMAKLYDVNGNEKDVVQVSAKTTRNETDPKITMNEKGKFAIAFLETNTSNSTKETLTLRRYAIASSGAKVSSLGGNTVANSPKNGSLDDYDLGMTNGGKTTVVYARHQTKNGSNVPSLNQRRFTIGGASSARRTLFPVTALTTINVSEVSVAVNPTSGNFAVAFKAQGGQVLVDGFAKSGKVPFNFALGATPQGALRPVDSSGGATQNSSISIDSAGNFFAAYFVPGENSGNVAGVFEQLL